jgi:hypothetical protein
MVGAFGCETCTASVKPASSRRSRSRLEAAATCSGLHNARAASSPASCVRVPSCFSVFALKSGSAASSGFSSTQSGLQTISPRRVRTASSMRTSFRCPFRRRTLAAKQQALALLLPRRRQVTPSQPTDTHFDLRMGWGGIGQDEMGRDGMGSDRIVGCIGWDQIESDGIGAGACFRKKAC